MEKDMIVMSEMVERVARIFTKAVGLNPDGISIETKDFPPGVDLFQTPDLAATYRKLTWAIYAEAARDAIAAMREPTDTMFDAGAESLYGHPRHKAEQWAKLDKYEGYGDSASIAYRAMIDAAMK